MTEFSLVSPKRIVAISISPSGARFLIEVNALVLRSLMVTMRAAVICARAAVLRDLALRFYHLPYCPAGDVGGAFCFWE